MAVSVGFSQYYYLPFVNAGVNPGGLNTDNEYPNGGGLDASWSMILGGSQTSPAWSPSQTIPFTFNFNGAAVTSYKVSSSGVLTFAANAGTAPTYTNAALPNSAIPDSSICIWGLKAAGANDNIMIKTFGTAPNRQQWIFFASYNWNSGGSSVWTYWSIVLEETTNNIYIVDQRTGNGTTSLTAGIQIDSASAFMVSGSPALANNAGTNATPSDNSYYQFVYGTQPVRDIKMLSFDMSDYAQSSVAIDVKGTFVNLGSADITTFDLNYSINGGTTVTSALTASVQSLANYNFTHPIQWTPPSAGSYILKVWATNINGGADQNNANDTITKTIMVANAFYTKNVVYEEGTGTWCGWCVRGLVGLNTMAHTITDGTWIGIGVHNNDPMVVSNYDAAIGNYISGYPSGIMDRFPDPVDPGLTSLQSAYNEHKVMPAIAKIEISNKTFNSSTGAWSLDVVTTFGLDIASANFNTALIIVENGVTGVGSGWSQKNYYSGGSYGNMIDYDGTNYANLPSTVPAADMVYNHVGRQLVDGFDGSSNSIPSSITYNTPYSFSYSGTLSSDINHWNATFVAIIIDNASGTIVNATEILLGNVGIDNPSTTNINNIYPNPTTGIVTIEGTKDAQVVVYNMVGEVVYDNKNASENTTIDLSAFSAGNYIVKIISDNNVSTQKIILTK